MNITFSLASFEDAERLFAWRNDEAERLYSHNSEPLNFDEHCKWLSELLSDNKRELLIVHLDGIPVGTLRIDSRQEVAELAWSTDINHRQRGIGKAMLKQFLNSRPGKYRAEIKAQNVASIKMAESAGMILIKTIGNICHYHSYR